MRFVTVELPYAARDVAGIDANTEYRRRALRDCILRGESPLPGRALYMLAGVLNDADGDERAFAALADLAWAPLADATVLYVDRGISDNMQEAIVRARQDGREIIMRSLIR
jgi:hypothetical protein